MTIPHKINSSGYLSNYDMLFAALGVAIQKLGGELIVTQADLDSIYQSKMYESMSVENGWVITIQKPEMQG